MLGQAKATEIRSIVEKVREIEKKPGTAMEIMEGYCWGRYANHQHYRVEDIQCIVEEVRREKAPVMDKPVDPREPG